MNNVAIEWDKVKWLLNSMDAIEKEIVNHGAHKQISKRFAELKEVLTNTIFDAYNAKQPGNADLEVDDLSDMVSDKLGWVVVNTPSEMNRNTKLIFTYSFGVNEQDSKRRFIQYSGYPWTYFEESFNYKCVKARQVIEQITKDNI